MPVQIKRIYEPSSPDDGYRVLVDRLWPGGIKKEQKWEMFIQKYAAELQPSAAFKDLERLIHHHKRITLLYSAKDEQHNQAAALLRLLQHNK